MKNIASAEKFATVRNGKIVLIADAFPEHKLLPNQIPLTDNEYKFLHGESDLELIRKLVASIVKKIKAIK